MIYEILNPRVEFRFFNVFDKIISSVTSMSLSENLEDFIPAYPDGDDPNIQRLLYAKKEFIDLASDMKEATPLRGHLYLNQELFIRYMSSPNYNSCLNISETGVGKSCQIIGLREKLKNTDSAIKHAYILQKPSTIGQFKNQIVCKCTNGIYETEMVKRASNANVRKSNISREISKWYTVTTYERFASEIINSSYTDAQIVEKYSGCLFALDEAHALRNEGKGDSAMSLTQIYDTIKRVLHLIKRSKIIISTATPVINDVKEFPRIANLALPPDKQLPEDWDYSLVSIYDIEPYLRNHIFYIRSLDTGAVPTYQGVKINQEYEIKMPDPQNPRRIISKNISSQTTVDPVTMGDLQNSVYIKLKNVKKEETSISFESKSSNEGTRTQFFMDARQVSSFVFPDGSYGGHITKQSGVSILGTRGISKYVISNGDNDYKMTDEFKSYVSNPNALKSMSCKYYDIVVNETRMPGCAFAYTDLVSGSGAIVLGLCMEAYQYLGGDSKDPNNVMYGKYFERFNERGSVFVSTGSNQGLCSETGGSRVIRQGFEKKPRYALLTGDTPTTIVDALLELVTSPENIDGEYVKLIIGSQVARDGINIYHCLRGYLVTVGWHPSGMHQALSRFLRTVSHDALIKRLQEEYIKQGLNPLDAKVPVNIYKFAAMPIEQDKYLSIDLSFYQHADRKSIPIARLKRMLKQIDFGCQINYARNVRDTDIDGSETCDYTTCRYVCSADLFTTPEELITSTYKPPPPEVIDTSTYDILYSDVVIDSCMREIIEILKTRGRITFDELKRDWVDTGIYRQKFIYMAVDKLINDKYQIFNRYGFKSYIYTDGFSIITQQDFPIYTSAKADHQELPIYGHQIIANTYTTFDELVAIQQIPFQNRIKGEIRRMNFNTIELHQQFNRLIDNLSIKAQIELLEECIILQVKNQLNPPYVGAVINHYKTFVKLVYEPWADIAHIKNLLSKGESINKQHMANRGKTHKDLGLAGPPPEGSTYPDGRPVEMVYIHSLHSTPKDLTLYDEMSTFKNVSGTIRIYKPASMDKFRDATREEFIPYNDIFQKAIAQLFDQYEQFAVYGSIIRNNFRIHIKNTDSGGKSIKDLRSRNSGRVCDSLDKAELINIVFEERIPLPVFSYPIMPYNINTAPIDKYNQLISFITQKIYSYPFLLAKLQNFNIEQLELLYSWYIIKPSKHELCQLIKNQFDKTHKLLVL